MTKTTKSHSFQIADFTLEKTLHHGAFGTVYRAIHKKTGVVYAMKQVCLKGMKRVDREEAIDEARVLAKLHHPFIIKHHKSFIEDEQLCILMDYAEGGSLYRKVRESPKGRLSQEETWKMFIQCLLALDYVFRKKIIHRDVKSLNILLLEKQGSFALSDFGIARVLTTDSDFARTLLGTPFYLSPELCDDAPYNEKSDIWALGVVVYECVTGELPFFAKNEGSLIRKILKGEYKAPRNCPEDLKEVISKCLTYDHHKRPTSRELLKLPCVKTRAKQLGIDLNLNIELEKKEKDEKLRQSIEVVEEQPLCEVHEQENEEKEASKIQEKADQIPKQEMVTDPVGPTSGALNKQQKQLDVKAKTQDAGQDQKQDQVDPINQQRPGVPERKQRKDQFHHYRTSRLQDEDLAWNAEYSAPAFARRRCPDLMATYPASVSRSMSSSTSSSAPITTKQAASTSYEQSVTSTCYLPCAK